MANLEEGLKCMNSEHKLTAPFSQVTIKMFKASPIPGGMLVSLSVRAPEEIHVRNFGSEPALEPRKRIGSVNFEANWTEYLPMKRANKATHLHLCTYNVTSCKQTDKRLWAIGISPKTH
jgi:hypothetical protein